MTTLPHLSSNTLNTNDLIGLSFIEAVRLANSKGWGVVTAKHNNITYHLYPRDKNTVVISIENDVVVTAKL